MKNRAQRAANANALPSGLVAARMAHRRSGAAGVHADQQTRRGGTFRTNRVGSRSSQQRAALRDQGRW